MAENQNQGAQNPFDNLDEQTKKDIQELQILEQNFQQLLMQKNSFSMESNETDLIIKETEKAEGDVFKIVGGQVVIKSTKDKIIEDAKKKKDLMDKRLKDIEEQEKNFSKKIEELRESVMKKIQG